MSQERNTWAHPAKDVSVGVWALGLYPKTSNGDLKQVREQKRKVTVVEREAKQGVCACGDKLALCKLPVRLSWRR